MTTTRTPPPNGGRPVRAPGTRDPRARRAARDEGLRRTRTVTSWTATGGVVATAVAALIFAHPITASDTPTAPDSVAPNGSPSAVAGRGDVGSGSRLQPPTLAPQHTAPGISHVPSGAS
mgnify:CR=1 FL=1